MKEIKTKQSTGAFALIDSLVRNGTTSLFGYPGGAILPIYDELYSWEKHAFLKHYLVRHEQGAAHAADGYARSSGKVGVCFATSGPGATNLVTGIATAQIDSIPMVIITGQVGRPFIGTDAFQEIDTFGITLPVVKHSYVIREARRMSEIISEAFFIAQNGRPGPVVIDVPKDVGLEKIQDYLPIQQKHILKILGYRFEYKTNLHQIQQAVQLLQASSQPLVYSGGGILTSNASLELMDFVQSLSLPITTTLMGKGGFDESHPLALGMLGMHGTAYANFAVSNCDLLIAIGARFDDRVTGKLNDFACNAMILHIDIDPAEIGKNKLPQLAMVGDVKQILRHLLASASIELKKQKEQSMAWQSQIKRWKDLYPLQIPNMENALSPQEAIYEIGKAAPQAYFSTDVGQHQMWSAQFIQCQARKWLSSSGLGTMGYGLPAAMGAQVAFPHESVVCVSGDSSFQMNLQELGSLAQYKLPVKIFVINNHWQGMVRQWQEAFYEQRYSHSNMEMGAPDLVKLGEAYGIKSFRIETRKDLLRQVPKILSLKEAVLVEVCVKEHENCYPMVAPGKSNEEMIGLQKMNSLVDLENPRSSKL